MAIGDRYLATVEVTQVADTEYRWEGAKISIFANEIKSLEKIREPLPLTIGSVVKFDEGSRAVYAMLREDGYWATSRRGRTLEVMTRAALEELDWSPVS